MAYSSRGMEAEVALQLAKKCLPQLEAKGMKTPSSVASVKTKCLLGLWTGMGSIDEVVVTGEDGATCSFVTKTVASCKSLEGDELSLMDHRSYANEAAFYDSGLADRMFTAGCHCPRGLLLEREADGALTLCMTKLTGGGFRRTQDQTREALAWLARLHAAFWGTSRTAEAVEMLEKHGANTTQACFWHLDTRHIELGRMAESDPLKMAARAIDARLKADKMQTMCHGDPKGANIMWDENSGVSLYDFQWFGKAPCSKDLAYFFGVAAPGLTSDEAEDALLRQYHEELSKLLAAQGDEAPEFEYLKTSYHLALCDLARWMKGGFSFGNTALIFRHAKEVLQSLKGEQKLKTEEDYQARLFEVFPP